jgi:4-carboxymuconolactone decarboxylase
MARLDPLPRDKWPDDLRPILEVVPEGFDASLGENNIFSTLARNPELFKAWLPFGGYLLGGGRLPAEDRELLILRTAVRTRSSYEWGQHVRISLGIGMSRQTIDRVAEGPDADGWSAHEAALLRAADELCGDSVLSEETWAALGETYDEKELIEAIMLVGHYNMVAFALNSLGVELDEGLEALPED